MKRFFLCLLAFPAFPATAPAQSPAPPAAVAPPVPASPAPDPARLKSLQKQVDAARKEIDKIAEDIRKTDDRIEFKISKAVETLAGLSDSKDSGTRIADAKGNVIDFLRKQITDYSQRRAQVRGQLENRQRTIPAEALEADIAKIDSRLDKRIAQVTAVGGSFARHEDYDKYVVTGTGWYGHTEFRINEDWKANRRATLKAAQEKGKLGDAIDDSMARLRSSNAWKQGQLAAASPETARLLKQDITRNESLIYALQRTQEALVLPPTASQQPVGALEAKSIEARLKKAGAEVRSDQWKLTGYYNRLNEARARHAALLQALNKAASPKATGP